MRSMTGFGRGEATAENGVRYIAEAKSVNHRYADVVIKAPRALAAQELSWSQRVKAAVSRGRVDVVVRREAPGGGHHVDRNLLRHLIEEHATARLESWGRVAPEPPRIEHLFAVPGVVVAGEPEADVEAESAAADEAIRRCVERLVEMRSAEGQRLSADLQGIVQRMAGLVGDAESLVDGARALILTRIRRRIAEVASDVSVDPARLAQEAAILAERADVSEELVRLRAHLDAITALFADAEPVGRRLDFLAQELHREATTLGNKSAETNLVRVALDLKAEIDRLKEQVMNVE